MKILYLNAIVDEPAGKVLSEGIAAGLAQADVITHGQEPLELFVYDMFYGAERSPLHMGRFAREWGADGIILSGSEKNTTDDGDPFVRDYYRGLRDLLEVPNEIQDWMGPQQPLLGICFGHQALACLLGGETSRFKRRVGLTKVQPLPAVHRHPWLRSLADEAPWEVAVSHSDHVVRLPRGFHVLVTSDYCSVHAMAHDQWPILTLQSHPEIVPALKDLPLEAADWEGITHEQMRTHLGPRLLARFADGVYALRKGAKVTR